MNRTFRLLLTTALISMSVMASDVDSENNMDAEGIQQNIGSDRDRIKQLMAAHLLDATYKSYNEAIRVNSSLFDIAPTNPCENVVGGPAHEPLNTILNKILSGSGKYTDSANTKWKIVSRDDGLGNLVGGKSKLSTDILKPWETDEADTYAFRIQKNTYPGAIVIKLMRYKLWKSKEAKSEKPKMWQWLSMTRKTKN